ncbi:MAG: excinuclease ABC subunit UvrC [bacterium]
MKILLNHLPHSPGVYLMYDSEDKIIYIGKAKDLKKRVKSYFTKKHDSPKLLIMVPQIVRFEFIITDSEVEALILESHLIKKHKPKYNVLLKDDKHFPWFLITEEEYPRIIITRKPDQKHLKGKYFGPYTDSRAMYSTLELIKKLFPLKQCKIPRFKDRPCIYYQIKRCFGPCQKLITSEEYKDIVRQVELFLSGKQTELLEKLKNEMEKYSENQEYEKAAKYRDSYFDVSKVIEKQKVVTDNTSINQDIIGYDNDDLRMSLVLLKVRDGRLIGKEDFEIKLNQIHTAKEALITFMQEYYQMLDEIPKEILIPDEIEDINLIAEWLSVKKGSKVTIIAPKLQTKHELVEMANKNASSALESIKISEINRIQNEWNAVGSFIQEKLELPVFPHKIECFDISHIQGTNTVASMVVFINGKSCKSEYRRFKIRSVDQGKTDDYASMKEVIKRRYTKLLKDNLELPNLIIVDGGKGQLSAAKDALEDIGLINQPIVALAKKFEEIYIPDNSIPVVFPANSQALFVFQKIRDEAHRFAISYHRQLRENQAIKSILDEISGLTHNKKKILLDHFGNIKGIMSATESEIARVIGKNIAHRIYKHLHKQFI